MRTERPEDVSTLRAARIRAGLSIEQLAVKAGIARQTLYIAEKAPQLMSDRTARAVAAVLGVEPEALREDIQ
jgi:DNA-binding XRE family transcriptional regulator